MRGDERAHALVQALLGAGEDDPDVEVRGRLGAQAPRRPRARRRRPRRCRRRPGRCPRGRCRRAGRSRRSGGPSGRAAAIETQSASSPAIRRPRTGSRGASPPQKIDAPRPEEHAHARREAARRGPDPRARRRSPSARRRSGRPGPGASAPPGGRRARRRSARRGGRRGAAGGRSGCSGRGRSRSPRAARARTRSPAARPRRSSPRCPSAACSAWTSAYCGWT